MGLDAVELILGWETAFEIQFTDTEAMQLQTPAIVIELISNKLGAIDCVGLCPIMEAHHRLQKGFQAVVGVPPHYVQLDSKFLPLLPRHQRQDLWQKVQDYLDIPKLPSLSFGVGVLFTPITIQQLVDWMVARYPRYLLGVQEPWTRTQVRSIVRAIVRDKVGITDFADDSDFVRDMGIN